MSEFNRHYVALSIVTIFALGCVLYASRGGDPAFGSFGSGLAVGVLVAFFFLRRAELRLAESRDEVNHHFEQSAEAVIAAPGQNDLIDSGLVPESDEAEAEADGRESAGVVSEFAAAPSHAMDEVALENVHVVRCLCVCGCNRRSNNGALELCGNCSRWWMQQSKRCECDLSTQDYCDCGVVNHGVAA